MTTKIASIKATARVFGAGVVGSKASSNKGKDQVKATAASSPLQTDVGKYTIPSTAEISVARFDSYDKDHQEAIALAYNCTSVEEFREDVLSLTNEILEADVAKEGHVRKLCPAISFAFIFTTQYLTSTSVQLRLMTLLI